MRTPFLVAATGGLAALLTAGAVPASDSTAAAAAGGCPSGQACVAVYDGDRLVQTFSPAQIESGDVQSGEQDGYAIRERGGSTCSQSDPIPAGSSVYDLLRRAGLSVGSQGHVAVSASGVPDINFSNQDMGADGGGDFYQTQIPVIYGDSSNPSLGFIRGLRADPDPCPTDGQPATGADYNAGTAGDFFDRQEIDVTVYSGPAVTVGIGPSDPQTAPARPVHVTASVEGSGSTSYRYHWDFGDGQSATTSTASATHRFTTAGSYEMSVSVDGSDGSHGQSPLDRVTVASSSPGPTPTPTTTVSSPSPGGTGPRPGPTTGPVHNAGRRAGANPRRSLPGLAVHGSAGVRVRAPAGPFLAPGKGRRGQAPRVAAGRIVTGMLLGDAQELTASADPIRPVAGSAPSAVAGMSPADRLGAAAGATAALVLIGSGAWRERRRSRWSAAGVRRR